MKINMNDATQAKGECEEVNVLDLIHTLLSNWSLLVLGPMLVGLLSVGVAFMLPPTYVATTKFLPPQQQQSAASAMLQSLGGLGSLAGATAGLKNPADQYIALLRTRAVQDVLVDRFKLLERYQLDFKDDAVKALDASVAITSAKDGIITVQVSDVDPVVAAKIANAYVEVLGQLLDRLSMTEAQQRRKFFEKQLLETKSNLAKAELALRATGVSELTMKVSPASAIAAVAQLQAQITAQEVRVLSMKSYMTPSAPQLKIAQTELDALRAESARLAKPGDSSAVDDAGYVAKYRDMKYYETLFELFAKQFELAKVDESRDGAMIQVVDTAQVPQRKSAPRKLYYLVGGGALSEIILLIFVFARQAIRRGAQDPEIAQKMNRLRTAWRNV